MSQLTTSAWKQCCIGSFGKNLHCVYSMYMRGFQWHCWSYHVDAITGTMREWSSWLMVQTLLFMNLMDACMVWSRNSRIQAWPSRNHGGSYRGVFHSLTCMRNVMAHIHMVHVQVEKLVQLNYTRTDCKMYHSRGEESNVVEYSWRDKATKESQEQNETFRDQGTKHAHAYPSLMMRMKTKRTSILTNFYSIGFAAEVFEGEAKAQSASRTVYSWSGFPSGWYHWRDGREEDRHCLRSQRVCSFEEDAASGRYQRPGWSAAKSLFNIWRSW